MQDMKLAELHALTMNKLRTMGLTVHLIRDGRRGDNRPLAVLMSYNRFLAMGNEILRLNGQLADLGIELKEANDR